MSVVTERCTRRVRGAVWISMVMITVPFQGMAQFGGAFIFDQGVSASGVTSIATADVDNDGFVDVITAHGYNQGRITLYRNEAGTLFNTDPLVIDANVPLAEDVTVADLNGDGWPDIIAITRFEGEVIWYPNSAGVFGERVVLDSGLVTLNGVVAGDVDGDGAADLVVIGQHSIDLFRNDGTGLFAREAILTTATSPLPLECMDLVLVDIDSDGDLDPVVAETIGPVIYVNAGDGTFTPTLVDPQPAIQAQMDVGDLDGDGDPDIVVVGFLGTARWYRNDGASWHDAGAILGGDMIRGLAWFDADGDGSADAIGARGVQLRFHRSMGAGAFAPDALVFNHADMLDEVAIADINGDGRPDVIWSAPAGTLAYQLNELTTGLLNTSPSVPFRLGIDASAGILAVWFDHQATERFTLFDTMGRTVRTFGLLRSGARIHVDGLAGGMYVLCTSRGAALPVFLPDH